MKYKLSKVCLATMLVFSLGNSACAYDFESPETIQKKQELSLKKKIIDKNISQIIRNLNLNKPKNTKETIETCLKVHNYIKFNSEYDFSMIDQKRGENVEELYTNDLYKVLTEKKGICTSNSMLFKNILQKLDIDVECVFLLSNDKQTHMCNIVNIDGYYYYFDTTLERAIYDSNHSDVIYCAGIGKKNYEKYYKPIGLLNDNLKSNIEPMPANISLYDMTNYETNIKTYKPQV